MSAFAANPAWPTIVELAIELWGQPNRAQSTKTDIRFGEKASKSVKPASNQWFDHEAVEGGGYIDLYKLARPGKPLPANHDNLPPWRNIDVAYDYLNADGKLVFQVVRTISGEPRFLQRRPDARGAEGQERWAWNMQGVTRVPYHLPQLRAADPASLVYIVEGEKDADRLTALNLLATTNSGGAGKWPAEFATYLTGFNVIILPDNDSAGEAHAVDVASKLLNTAASIRIVHLPNLPDKGDISDWLNAGNSLETLDDIVAATPEFDRDQNVVDLEEAKAEKAEKTERRKRSNDPPPDPDQIRKIIEETSEEGIQINFTATYGLKLQHVAVDDRWFYWTGARWVRDLQKRVPALIKQFLWKLSSGTPHIEEGKRIASAKTARAVEFFAQSDPVHAALADQWDREPFLLGTPANVVDLRTGELRPQRIDDFLLHSTAVEPAEPGTPAPIWDSFLNDITKGDIDYQRFLQRLFGYFLTGDNAEEIFVFLYGKGENGKGTFIRSIARVMGHYWGTVKRDIFLKSDGAYPSASDEYHKATMVGKRLITIAEGKADAKWGEDDLKMLTGNDTPVSARRPRGEPFEFVMKAKIAIVADKKPKIHDRSRAMRRRLRMCPFLFRTKNPDKTLKDRLQTEDPQVLRWLIDGAVMWSKEGLGSCPIVTRATAEYFREGDNFATWVNECCDLDPNADTPTTYVLQSYNAFLLRNGLQHDGADTISDKKLTQFLLELDDEDFFKTKAHGNQVVRGLRLKQYEQNMKPIAPRRPCPRTATRPDDQSRAAPPFHLLNGRGRHR
jgi:putative DNA primase/helicase